MNILALDPGSDKTGWIKLTPHGIGDFGIYPNEGMARFLKAQVECEWEPTHFVCEHLAAMYGTTGPTHNETVFWCGRFCQVLADLDRQLHLITRTEIKLHLCGTSRVGDPQIREELIRRYGPQKIEPASEFEPNAKGRLVRAKAKPGPTAGIVSHVWAALAVGTVFMDQQEAR